MNKALVYVILLTKLLCLYVYVHLIPRKLDPVVLGVIIGLSKVSIINNLARSCFNSLPVPHRYIVLGICTYKQ